MTHLWEVERLPKMSILNNRNWVGSEISNEYCNIIEERIKKAWEEKRKRKSFKPKQKNSIRRWNVKLAYNEWWYG